MPGQPWPRIAIEEARQAYETGVPATVIARGLGCTRQQVERWVAAGGWTVRGFVPSETARVRLVARGKVGWVREREERL